MYTKGNSNCKIRIPGIQELNNMAMVVANSYNLMQIPQTEISYFTIDEIIPILNLAKKQNFRDYVFLLFAYQTGARVTELVKPEKKRYQNELEAFKRKHIDFIAKTVTLKTLKKRKKNKEIPKKKTQLKKFIYSVLDDPSTSFENKSEQLYQLMRVLELTNSPQSQLAQKEREKKTKKAKPEQKYRTIPILDNLITNLALYQEQEQIHKPEDIVFNFTRQHANNILKRYTSQLGITDGRDHIHSFRHSHCIHSLALGMPITIIKERVGHSSIFVTLRYLQFVRSAERIFLEKVYQQLFDSGLTM